MIPVKKLLITMGFLLLAYPAWAGVETVIELKNVPVKFLGKAQNLLPEAIFSTANTEEEVDGTFVYEIQGTLPDGRKVEVDLFKNGNIQEIEIEFSKDMVPGAVLKALKDKLPGFTPTYIEASHSASRKVTGYEFVGNMSGNTLDVEVSADGRRVEKADQ